MIIILILNHSIALVVSDLGYYKDTVGSQYSDEYLALADIPTVQISIITDGSYLAGTTSIIYATFLGEFSMSGPHSLGNSFTAGTTTEVDVQLTRAIGTLKQVQLMTKGSDGFLLHTMTCIIDNRYYELYGDRQWLDAYSIATFNAKGDGFEPYASLDIPAAATLMLSVVNSYDVYTLIGLSQ